MWVQQVKQETINEYNKFVYNLSVGKEFDYSLILDMINLIDVYEMLNHGEADTGELEEQIKEIQNSVTNINEQITNINQSVDNRSKIHVGEFNANEITEEGWYDSVVEGIPEGSEPNEKYFLYHSSNGGQTCFSRDNSGKAYHRLDSQHLWAALTVSHSYDNGTLIFN